MRNLASAAMRPDEQPAYTVATLTGASARQSGCRTSRTLFPVGLPHLAYIRTCASRSTNHPAAFSVNLGWVVRQCATIRTSCDRLRSFVHALLVRRCFYFGRAFIATLSANPSKVFSYSSVSHCSINLLSSRNRAISPRSGSSFSRSSWPRSCAVAKI